MRYDIYGQVILTEQDIANIYMQNRVPQNTVLVDQPITFDSYLELENLPKLEQYLASDLSVQDWDYQAQQCWNMPPEYLEMDIVNWILDQCTTEHELQRVGQELLRYQELDLFNMLKYIKYLVDTMRQHNILWGVGRGSSVSSYVLYLIGVHRINSMYYDLDYMEFLK